MISMGRAPHESADVCWERRRDFTINSLFYNINTSEVEDFTKRGLDDLLENMIIRTPMPASETFRDGEPEQENVMCSTVSCLPAWLCLASIAGHMPILRCMQMPDIGHCQGQQL